MWRADAVRQRYLPGTNVLRTVARFGRRGCGSTSGARGGAGDAGRRRREPSRGSRGIELRRANGRRGEALRARLHGGVRGGGDASSASRRRRGPPLAAARAAARARRSRLGAAMYERSLLVLHALTDRRTAPSPPVPATAGPTSGRATPRRRRSPTPRPATAPKPNASTQLPARPRPRAGRPLPRRRQSRPRPCRPGRRDRLGRRRLPGRRAHRQRPARGHDPRRRRPVPWRDRADYWEGEPGDYLGNALASARRV